jgi:bifunctional UDP-N-acetylglucosamine pyrophosphorylase/glucosamine-1-phosphate N-acetyltransferase
VPESAALRVRRPWELLAATEAVLADQSRSVDGDVHPDADLRGAVVVEPGAEIDAGVVVEGPAYVSSGSTVGPNAYVRGKTLLDVDVHVGHGVEIKGSVLMAGASAPHLSYVGDSVIGPGANLGAGTVVANLRHDEADVRVTHDGDRVSTGRRKFGAVVGADAKLGIGTRLNAGVTVGPGGTTHPGEVLTRDRDVEGA